VREGWERTGMGSEECCWREEDGREWERTWRGRRERGDDGWMDGWMGGWVDGTGGSTGGWWSLVVPSGHWWSLVWMW
jgi:hypothetical protein